MATKTELEKQAENEVKFKGWWKSMEDHRSDYDWKWFIYDLWVTGNHYAKFDKDTQQVVSLNTVKGVPKVVINKVYTTLRSVRNFTLRNRPRAEVTPEDMTEEQVEQAVKLNRFLDFLHDKLRLRNKLKATLWHALVKSVGIWQVLWNEDTQEIEVNVCDPYDVYFDPVARTPEELRYVGLAVRRPVEEVNNDPKYREYIKKNKIELKGDGKLAASSMKERLANMDKSGASASGGDKNTVIVKELMYKEWNEEEKKYKIFITAQVEGTTIRPPEETELTRLPYFILPCDVDPLKIYGQGWVKNLIPVNRLLNRLESSVAEYNDIVNKGRFVADKGAGVRAIYNQHGQIIEKKRGFDVVQQPITPLNPAIFNQINNCNTYLEDLGGAHDASMGRVPTGAKSGKALEALQVGDSNNMSEIVENVEEFLEDVYEYILALAAEKYQFARRIVPITAAGERDFIDVIGEDAQPLQEGQAPEGMTIIPKKSMVDVHITSWLAQTQEARRDTLKELFELQAIDNETLLRGYEIGNVADVITKLRKEKDVTRAQDMAQQVTLANAQNQNKMGGQQEAPPTQVGAMQANAALQAVIQGQEPELPAPEEITPEFVEYIDSFIQSPQFKTLEEDAQQAVQAFRAQLGQIVR
jgi:hypothetical protein